MNETNTNQVAIQETLTEISYIANHWPYLQPHVREAIMMLVDCALTDGLEQFDLEGECGEESIGVDGGWNKTSSKS